MGEATRRLAAVMVSDMADYGVIAGRDEALAFEQVRLHANVSLPLFEANRGRLVKSLGDGFLVEFPSALSAVRCAIAIQTSMAEQAITQGDPTRVPLVRIGIHLCDIECIDGDILGDGVNIAARIEGEARPGGICISEDVFRQVRNHLDLQFIPRGPRHLRHVERPLSLYDVVVSSKVGEHLPQPEEQPTVVAVLPFANFSSEPDNEFFCHGLADELINALTKIGTLSVVSRTSSFALTGKDRPLREVGEVLGATVVVEGSVRKAGDRIRVTAQLISVAGDVHLWSEQYDREFSDIFAIQEEITSKIVEALRVVLTPQERGALERPPKVDLRAYELFLQGQHYYRKGALPDYRAARSCFRKAIEIDPSFARAYAALGQCAAYQYLHWEASTDALEEAQMAGAKAIVLDPQSSECCVAAGLNLSIVGSYEEAAKVFERALSLDPRCYEAWYALGRARFAQSKFAEAAYAYEKGAGVRLGDFQCLGLAMTAYKALGDTERRRQAAARALPIIQRHRMLHPDDARAAYFEGSIHTILEDKTRTVECLQRALELGPDDQSILYNVACVYGLLGMKRESLRYLEHAAKVGFVDRDWLVNDPDLRLAREAPAFARILKSVERNRRKAEGRNV